mgnify:CR=1 FL=1
MKRLYSALLSACLFIFSESALTQSEFIESEVFDMSLEELLNVEVITASKAPESLWSAPSVITVISQKEIQLFGSRDLADVLEKIVGMQPYFQAAFGLSFLAVRGDTPLVVDARTLVLVDGRPMFRNSLAHSTNVLPYTLYPLESLQRIEVIRGPGSVLYGSGAFSSVINLITKKVHVSTASLSLGLGSFGTVDSTLNASYSADTWSLQSTTRFIDQDGDDFDATGVDGLPTKSNFYENSSFMSHNKLTWQGFEATLIRSESERMTWFPSIQVKDDGVPRFENERTSFDIGYRWQINNTFRMEANTAYHREHFFDTSYSLGGGANDPVIERNAIGEDYHYELTVFGNHDNLGLNYVIGVIRDRSSGEDKDNPGVPARLKPNQWDYWIDSAYFQTTYSLNNVLSVTAGAQYNKPDFSPGGFSPRFGLVGNYPNGFGFKLLYGEAFRAPVVGERFTTLDTLAGNPDLTNELIATTEIQLSHHTETSELSMTLYNSQISDIISTTQASTVNTQVQFINQGKRTLQGVEIEGKLSFLSHWYLSGNYSWQQNKTDGVDDTTLQPPWLLNVGLGKRDANYHLGLFDTIISRYGKVSDVNPDVLSVNPDNEIYHLVSASASWHFQHNEFKEKNVKLNLSIHNLLNEDINIPDFAAFTLNTIPGGSGRSILVSLKIEI